MLCTCRIDAVYWDNMVLKEIIKGILKKYNVLQKVNQQFSFFFLKKALPVVRELVNKEDLPYLWYGRSASSY